MADASYPHNGHRASAHLEPASPPVSGEQDTEPYDPTRHPRPEESHYPKPTSWLDGQTFEEGDDELDIALEEDYPSKVKSPPGIKRVLNDEKSKLKPDKGVASVSRKRSRKRSTPSTGRHTKRRRRKVPKRKSHSRRRNKKRRVRKAPKRKTRRRRGK